MPTSSHADRSRYQIPRRGRSGLGSRRFPLNQATILLCGHVPVSDTETWLERTVRSRDGEDAAVLVVHGSGDAAAGGGADPPAGVAVRGAHRTARDAGLRRLASGPNA